MAKFPKNRPIKHVAFGLDEMKNIRAGKAGTCCDGSKRLNYFWSIFHKNDAKISAAVERGKSTNIMGKAPSYLKSTAETPLSTSEIHNCSVAYFYNAKTNTHFLLHMHPDYVKDGFVEKMLERFMPEGFQYAIIVLGDLRLAKVHERYLPKVFQSIRNTQKDATIQVFHNATRMPEIVGYKGNVYEIPNIGKTIALGQSSFAKIEECVTVETLDYIEKMSRISSLKFMKKNFLELSYDEKVKEVLCRMIDKRIEALSEEKGFWVRLTESIFGKHVKKNMK